MSSWKSEHDPALLMRMNATARSVVFADLGLNTRDTMLHWVTANGTGLVVTPPALTATWRNVSERHKIKIGRLVTTTTMRRASIRLADRICFEMDSMGVRDREFVLRCVREGVHLSIRCLHQDPKGLINLVKPHAFTILRYRLKCEAVVDILST